MTNLISQGAEAKTIKMEKIKKYFSENWWKILIYTIIVNLVFWFFTYIKFPVDVTPAEINGIMLPIIFFQSRMPLILAIFLTLAIELLIFVMIGLDLFQKNQNNKLKND